MIKHLQLMNMIVIDGSDEETLWKLRMNTLKKKQIDQYIDSFPVLPSTVIRLMKVTAEPDSSAQDVMDVILPDQSLCFTILKIANSVLFGRPKKVDSIKLAVTILGFNEVQSIALSKALINSFSEIDSLHKPFVNQFWEHSFLCALAARRIAEDMRLSQDTAFTAGLIHDIGKLIILQTFADRHSPDLWLNRLSNIDTLKEELETFSFTHDKVGGQLLSKWYFPESLITAVKFHHEPTLAQYEKKYAFIVQLADFFAFMCANRNNDEKPTIVKLSNSYFPDLYSLWCEENLQIKEKQVEEWFDWLVQNYEQGNNLKEMFFA